MNTHKLLGSQKTQGAVGTNFVVINSPLLDRAFRVRDRKGPVQVQALVSECPVEAFDEFILDWLARLDEVELHTSSVGRGIERTAAELGAVVRDDHFGQASGLFEALHITSMTPADGIECAT